MVVCTVMERVTSLLTMEVYTVALCFLGVLASLGITAPLDDTAKTCTCTIASSEVQGNLITDTGKTFVYRAWPQPTCAMVQDKCAQQCLDVFFDFKRKHEDADFLFKRINKESQTRTMGYDLCLQFKEETPKGGITIKMIPEVSGCSLSNQVVLTTKLCCGFTDSNIQEDEGMIFGWFPFCKRTSFVYA